MFPNSGHGFLWDPVKIIDDRAETTVFVPDSKKIFHVSIDTDEIKPKYLHPIEWIEWKGVGIRDASKPFPLMDASLMHVSKERSINTEYSEGRTTFQSMLIFPDRPDLVTFVGEHNAWSPIVGRVKCPQQEITRGACCIGYVERDADSTESAFCLNLDVPLKWPDKFRSDKDRVLFEGLTKEIELAIEEADHLAKKGKTPDDQVLPAPANPPPRKDPTDGFGNFGKSNGKKAPQEVARCNPGKPGWQHGLTEKEIAEVFALAKKAKEKRYHDVLIYKTAIGTIRQVRKQVFVGWTPDLGSVLISADCQKVENVAVKIGQHVNTRIDLNKQSRQFECDTISVILKTPGYDFKPRKKGNRVEIQIKVQVHLNDFKLLEGVKFQGRAVGIIRHPEFEDILAFEEDVAAVKEKDEPVVAIVMHYQGIENDTPKKCRLILEKVADNFADKKNIRDDSALQNAAPDEIDDDGPGDTDEEEDEEVAEQFQRMDVNKKPASNFTDSFANGGGFGTFNDGSESNWGIGTFGGSGGFGQSGGGGGWGKSGGKGKGFGDRGSSNGFSQRGRDSDRSGYDGSGNRVSGFGDSNSGFGNAGFGNPGFGSRGGSSRNSEFGSFTNGIDDRGGNSRDRYEEDDRGSRSNGRREFGEPDRGSSRGGYQDDGGGRGGSGRGRGGYDDGPQRRDEGRREFGRPDHDERGSGNRSRGSQDEEGWTEVARGGKNNGGGRGAFGKQSPQDEDGWIEARGKSNGGGRGAFGKQSPQDEEGWTEVARGAKNNGGGRGRGGVFGNQRQSSPPPAYRRSDSFDSHMPEEHGFGRPAAPVSTTDTQKERGILVVYDDFQSILFTRAHKLVLLKGDARAYSMKLGDSAEFYVGKLKPEDCTKQLELHVMPGSFSKLPQGLFKLKMETTKNGELLIHDHAYLGGYRDFFECTKIGDLMITAEHLRQINGEFVEKKRLAVGNLFDICARFDSRDLKWQFEYIDHTTPSFKLEEEDEIDRLKKENKEAQKRRNAESLREDRERDFPPLGREEPRGGRESRGTKFSVPSSRVSTVSTAAAPTEAECRAAFRELDQAKRMLKAAWEYRDVQKVIKIEQHDLYIEIDIWMVEEARESNEQAHQRYTDMREVKKDMKAVTRMIKWMWKNPEVHVFMKKGQAQFLYETIECFLEHIAMEKAAQEQ